MAWKLWPRSSIRSYLSNGQKLEITPIPLTSKESALKSLDRRRRSIVAILALAVALVFCTIIATSLGAVAIPSSEVAKMLVDRLPVLSCAPTWTEQAEAIVFRIRLPRVATAVVVGGALATAGTIFQGLLRNPMADPYIIGTSGGAALGATIALLVPSKWSGSASLWCR